MPFNSLYKKKKKLDQKINFLIFFSVSIILAKHIHSSVIEHHHPHQQPHTNTSSSSNTSSQSSCAALPPAKANSHTNSSLSTQTSGANSGKMMPTSRSNMASLSSATGSHKGGSCKRPIFSPLLFSVFFFRWFFACLFTYWFRTHVAFV